MKVDYIYKPLEVFYVIKCRVKSLLKLNRV
jgi:hypothetical protein